MMGSAGVRANPRRFDSIRRFVTPELACKDRAELPHHWRRCLGQIGVGWAEPDRRGPSEARSFSTATPGGQLSGRTLQGTCFEVSVPATNETLASTVCMLAVPVNKTSTAFTKAVDPIVGEMVKPLTGCADHPEADRQAGSAETARNRDRLAVQKH